MRHVLAALAALVALTAPSAAHAAVVPTLSSGRLEIRMTAPGDQAVIARSANALVLTGNGAAATVGTLPAVAEIAFVDASGGATEAVIDMSGGRLEGVRTTVALGDDTGADAVRILGETGGDKIYIGPSGANLSAQTDHELDLVAPTGVDRWILEGRGGRDLLSAGGSAGEPVGGPMTVPVEIIAGPDGGLFSGGAADDVIRGGAGNDQLYGGDGNDHVTTGGGSDKLSGGTGDDVLDNGPGPDDIAGDAGRDQLVHQSIGGPVDIDLARGESEGAGGAGSDQIDGIETVVGTPFADRLAGNEGSNRVVGAGGDDVLAGGVGDDLLEGGEGDDTLSGDLGEDVVDGGAGRDAAGYATAPGGVSVRLAGGGGGTSSAASGADRLAGIEDVIGSPYNDNLSGDDGPNRLAGGDGRDRLVGRRGSDSLEGGAGDDDIRSADGVRDIVGCGEGTDIFDTDRRDALAGDCEVRGGPRRMEVLALTYRAGARRVAVRLRCPATLRFACRGKVRLKAKVRSRGRVRTVGAARWVRFNAILAGRTRTITRPLQPAARRALRRQARRVKLVVDVVARDGGRRKVGVRVVRRATRLRSARRAVSGDGSIRPGRTQMAR